MLNNIKTALIAFFLVLTTTIQGQSIVEKNLDKKQRSIISIAALTGKGDLENLQTYLNAGLDSGLTINEIKEVLMHVYAYAGFPRSLRGLQTFMLVVEDRKTKGIKDVLGGEASPIHDERSKYERGKAILEELSGVAETGPKTGYAAFSPTIEIFLKEHLYLFERDVLSYQERELVTISVLSGISGVEPMLRSHLNLCLNVGLSSSQLQEYITVIKETVGTAEANDAQQVLDEVLTSRK